MADLLRLIFGLVVDLFRSRAALEAEIVVLRQQIIVLRRGKPTRLPFLAANRWTLGWVCRLFPNARHALAIVRPDRAPRYLIHDRDVCYGAVFTRRLQSLGIRDHPTSARSPWQNGYAELLIGSIRREALTTSLSLGSGIYVMCCPVTWPTTIRSARIYHWTRMRQSNVRPKRPDA
jgi:hypothetical protein